MSVISIDRDSGISVNIVRMAVTDQFSAVGVPGYILANQASIVAANMGAFSWNASDEVLVTASDGNSYFTISSDFNSLVPSGSGSQLAQVSLTAAQFNGMYAAPVLLVPAPSAGTMNIVDKLILVQHFVSASFAAGGVIAAQYDSTVHGAGVVASATLAAATLNANFYINGALSGTANQSSGTPTAPIAGSSIIIGNNSAQTGTFDGSICQVAIWSRIMGLEEIKTLYRNISLIRGNQ